MGSFFKNVDNGVMLESNLVASSGTLPWEVGGLIKQASELFLKVFLSSTSWKIILIHSPKKEMYCKAYSSEVLCAKWLSF